MLSRQTDALLAASLLHPLRAIAAVHTCSHTVPCQHFVFYTGPLNHAGVARESAQDAIVTFQGGENNVVTTTAA